jgi:hypothetical protein
VISLFPLFATTAFAIELGLGEPKPAKPSPSLTRFECTSTETDAKEDCQERIYPSHSVQRADPLPIAALVFRDFDEGEWRIAPATGLGTSLWLTPIRPTVYPLTVSTFTQPKNQFSLHIPLSLHAMYSYLPDETTNADGTSTKSGRHALLVTASAGIYADWLWFTESPSGVHQNRVQVGALAWGGINAAEGTGFFAFGPIAKISLL